MTKRIRGLIGRAFDKEDTKQLRLSKKMIAQLAFITEAYGMTSRKMALNWLLDRAEEGIKQQREGRP